MATRLAQPMGSPEVEGPMDVEEEPHVGLLTASELLDWIERKHILEDLFGQLIHEELVPRTGDLLRLLIQFGRFTPRHMDMVLAAAEGRHESIVQAVFQLLSECVIVYLPPPLLVDLAEAVRSHSALHAYAKCLRLMYEIASRIILAQPEQMRQPAKDILDFIWHVCQLYQPVAVAGLGVLHQLNSHIFRPIQLDFMHERVCELQAGTAPDTYVIHLLPPLLMGSSTHPTVIQVGGLAHYLLQQQPSLPKLLVDQLCHGPPPPPPTSTEHDVNSRRHWIYLRLQLLSECFRQPTTMAEPGHLALDDLRQLWRRYIVEPAALCDSSALFLWLRNLAGLFDNTNMAEKLPAQVFERRSAQELIFYELLPSLDFTNLGNEGYVVLQQLFLELNMARGRIHLEPAAAVSTTTGADTAASSPATLAQGQRLIVLDQCEGVEIFWNVMLQAGNSAVSERAMHCLVELHAQSAGGPDSRSQLAENFVGHCMQVLSSPDGDDPSIDPRRATEARHRVLTLLQELINSPVNRTLAHTHAELRAHEGRLRGQDMSLQVRILKPSPDTRASSAASPNTKAPPYAEYSLHVNDNDMLSELVDLIQRTVPELNNLTLAEMKQRYMFITRQQDLLDRPSYSMPLRAAGLAPGSIITLVVRCSTPRPANRPSLLSSALAAARDASATLSIEAPAPDPALANAAAAPAAGFIGPMPPPPAAAAADASDTPVEQTPMFLLAQTKYFGQLFTLLSGPAPIAERVFRLLMVLPTNSELYGKIERLSSPDWSQLLSTESQFQLVYLLQIVLLLVQNQHTWVARLKDTGGVTHLLTCLLHTGLPQPSEEAASGRALAAQESSILQASLLVKILSWVSADSADPAAAASSSAILNSDAGGSSPSNIVHQYLRSDAGRLLIPWLIGGLRNVEHLASTNALSDKLGQYLRDLSKSVVTLLSICLHDADSLAQFLGNQEMHQSFFALLFSSVPFVRAEVAQAVLTLAKHPVPPVPHDSPTPPVWAPHRHLSSYILLVLTGYLAEVVTIADHVSLEYFSALTHIVRLDLINCAAQQPTFDYASLWHVLTSYLLGHNIVETSATVTNVSLAGTFDVLLTLLQEHRPPIEPQGFFFEYIMFLCFRLETVRLIVLFFSLFFPSFFFPSFLFR